MSKNILNLIKDIGSTAMFIIGLLTIIESIHGVLLLGTNNHVLELFQLLKNVIVGLSGITIGSFIKHRIIVK